MLPGYLLKKFPKEEASIKIKEFEKNGGNIGAGK